MLGFINSRRGDTIVEVMIAVVILGAALGSAYSIAGRSQRQTIANHENSQAHLLANKQVDLIRAYQSNNREKTRVDVLNDIGTSGNCMSDAASLVGGACNVTLAGYGANYVVTIKSVSGSPYYVEINVDWDSLSQSGRSNVRLKYVI